VGESVYSGNPNEGIFLWYRGFALKDRSRMVNIGYAFVFYFNTSIWRYYIYKPLFRYMAAQTDKQKKEMHRK